MNHFIRPTLVLAAAAVLLPACSSDSRDYSQEFRDIDTRLDAIEDKLAAPVPAEVSNGVPYYDASDDTVPDLKIIVPGPMIEGSRFVACPIAVTQSGCYADWVDYGLSPTLAMDITDVRTGTAFCTIDRAAGKYTSHKAMSEVTFTGSVPTIDVQVEGPGESATKNILGISLGLYRPPGMYTPRVDMFKLSFPGSCDFYLNVPINSSAATSPETEGDSSD